MKNWETLPVLVGRNAGIAGFFQLVYEPISPWAFIDCVSIFEVQDVVVVLDRIDRYLLTYELRIREFSKKTNVNRLPLLKFANVVDI